MSAQLTDAEKIRKLPWLIAGGTLNSIFCALTVFGSVFVLFLDELGLPKTRIGILLSFVPFSGIIALFISGRVARAGFKKVFITFFGMRKVVVSLILFTPMVLSTWGTTAAFLWVAGIMAVFSLCRAIAETAIFPWLQELVPNAIRGKVNAISFASSNIFSMLATAVAGYVIGHGAGIGRFMILMTIGISIGILSVVARLFVPGGAPEPEREGEHIGARSFMETLRDGNFRVFLGALALTAFGVTPLASFIPLFLKEQVGITPGDVIYLQMAGSAGGLLSSYIWGWTADRYGNKPIMLSGLGLLAALPLLFWAIPRHSPMSYPAAIAATALQGVAGTGWFMGYFNYLFILRRAREQEERLHAGLLRVERYHQRRGAAPCRTHARLHAGDVRLGCVAACGPVRAAIHHQRAACAFGRVHSAEGPCRRRAQAHRVRRPVFPGQPVHGRSRHGALPAGAG